MLLLLGVTTPGWTQQSTEVRLTRIEESLKAINQRFDAVDKRIDDLNQSLNKRLDDTNQRIEARLEDMNNKFNWVFGLLATIMGLLAGLFGYLLVSGRRTAPSKMTRLLKQLSQRDEVLKQLSQRDEELSKQIRQLQTEIAALKRSAA
jgi:cell division protein FtsB